MTSTVTIGWRNPTGDPNFTGCFIYRGPETTFADAVQISPFIVGGLGELMTWDDVNGLIGGPYYWWVQANDSQGQTAVGGPASLSTITGYNACGGTIAPLAVLDFKNGVYWNGLADVALSAVLSVPAAVSAGYGLNLVYFNPSSGDYGIFPGGAYAIQMIEPNVMSILSNRNYTMYMKFNLPGDLDSYLTYAYLQPDGSVSGYNAQIGLSTNSAPAQSYALQIEENGVGVFPSAPSISAATTHFTAVTTVTGTGNDKAYINGSAPVVTNTSVYGNAGIDSVDFNVQAGVATPAYLESIIIYPVMGDVCASGDSAVSGTTQPGPVFTSGTYAVGGHPSLNWTNPTWTGVTLDHLRVFRNTSQNFGTATDVSGSLVATTTSFSDSGFPGVNAQVYYWWVVAYNAAETVSAKTAHKAVGFTVALPSSNYVYAGNANLIVTNSTNLSEFPLARSDGLVSVSGYSYSGTITGGGSPWQLTLSGNAYMPGTDAIQPPSGTRPSGYPTGCFATGSQHFAGNGPDVQYQLHINASGGFTIGSINATVTAFNMTYIGTQP